MQRAFLILILIITSIYTASCGELNTIYFPGDILTKTCIGKPNFTLINNEQELKDMNADGNYCLTQDINIDTWGEKQQPFTGTFDGNNKTITIGTIEGRAFIQQIGPGGTFRNVTLIVTNEISSTTNSVTGGLVVDNNGTIDNVTLKDVKVNGKSSHAGGLAVNNYGTIKNVTLKDVEVKGSGEVGGLVALNEGTIEQNVTLTKVKVKGSGEVGGLVAYNEGTINSAKVSGSITATVQSNIGGLVGYNNNSGKSITNSHANTTITYPNAVSINAGGFIGLQELGTITNCSSSGKLQKDKEIRTNTPANLGGFIGKTFGDCTIEKSFSTTTIDFDLDNIKVGGFIGLQEGGTIKNAYSAGKLTSGDYKSSDIYLGGFIGQQTSGNIYYVYTRSTITDLSITGPNIKAGHLAGKLEGTSISRAYYIDTKSQQITQAVGEGDQSGTKVEVDANGDPDSGTSWALNVPNDPDPVWHIKDGKWPTLINNPE